MRRSALGLARSFQITSLFLDFSVLDNVALAVQAHAGHSFRFWRKARREPELRDPARAALARRRPGARADLPASALSHGEHRQLELAMALASQTAHAAARRADGGPGPEESARMVAMLRELKKELTILLVEHDMEAVFALADRITVLVYGRVIASGKPEDIRGNVQVRDAYLGEQEAASMAEARARARRHRNLLRPQPGAVRRLACDRSRRDGDVDGPQRHGQDHHRALDHGTDAGARRAPSVSWATRFAACRHTSVAQLGIGLVPEGRQIFPNLSVRENLLATAVKRDGEDLDT